MPSAAIARPASRTPFRPIGLWQLTIVGVAILVLLGANFGTNSDMEDIATKSSMLNTPIQAAVLGTLVWLAVHYRGLQTRALPALVPFLVLLALAAGSSLWSQAPDASLRRSLSLMSLLALAVYAQTVLGTVAFCRVHVLVTWIAAGASLAAAVVVPHSAFDLGEYATAIRGIFTQKNTLGDAMVVGTLALMYVVLKRRRVVGSDIATLVMAAAVIRLAQSTTALLLFLMIVTSTVYALLWMRGTAASIYGIILLTVLILSLALVMTMDPKAVYGALGKNETLTGRVQIWRAVVQAGQGWPLLGYGYSAFWLPDTHMVGDIWYEIGWKSPSAHSGYLDTIMQIGVLGLGILGWIAALTVVRAVKAIGRDRLAEGWWALTILATILFYNYDESSLPQPDIHLFQWALAFLACACPPMLHTVPIRLGFRAGDRPGGQFGRGPAR
ncbi:O-antigen ligase family protein [Methylobacterium sp. J-076]|uniref:O-antigen ligase family protein n=1 Tax=Methylobacterium sp. J-076 TaxID=2836655 RepID=UPI001FBA8768|nr:O-antigen ligase family protein [Methylobacterium sp. J-076]MCJ2015108.1 hypothetical protein [Methylobacterium sp. J-076]